MSSENIRTRFRALYGGTPRVFRAPGRINLIGEHTDYNDGFVLPAAIPLETCIAAAPSMARDVSLRSSIEGEFQFSLDDAAPRPKHDWSDYPRGVAWALERSGFDLHGASLLIEGDLPIGAGLSSSASIEVATALALLAVADITLDRLDIVKACHRAETEFVGARVGMMDQFASCFGQKDYAILLDCRSLEFRRVKIPAGTALVACNTMVRHQLAAGEYNARRAECETAVREFTRWLPEVRALRDVTPADLERYGERLDEIVFRRARHVVSENQRVLDAVDALEARNLARVGELMLESHESLRCDYEVSCEELDLMCDLAMSVDGVYGARMTGGGFGGSIVALLESSQIGALRQTVEREYQTHTGIVCETYVCSPADGAGEVKG